MGMLDTGRSGLALLLVGSAQTPNYMGIGSGSGIFVVTQTQLIYENTLPANRRLWTSRSISTTKEVAYIFDWNSVEMSGLKISEFGISNGSIATAQSVSGTMWTRDIINTITFDGTSEIQIQLTLQVF